MLIMPLQCYLEGDSVDKIQISIRTIGLLAKYISASNGRAYSNVKLRRTQNHKWRVGWVQITSKSLMWLLSTTSFKIAGRGTTFGTSLYTDEAAIFVAPIKQDIQNLATILRYNL